MTTILQKNPSHRKLIKQKTRELIDYHCIAPRSTKNLQSRVVDITNVLSQPHNSYVNIGVIDHAKKFRRDFIKD